MGYLSKLRHETQARAPRSLQPSWIREIPQVVETQQFVGENPMSTSAISRPVQTETVEFSEPRRQKIPANAEAKTQRIVEQKVVEKIVHRQQVERVADDFSGEDEVIPSKENQGREPIPAQVQASLGLRAVLDEAPKETKETYSESPARAADVIKPASPLVEGEPMYVEKHESKQQVSKPQTLATILVEIEQKQEELNRKNERHEKNSVAVQVPVRGHTLPLETSSNENRLHIGSIVVEVEPEQSKVPAKPVVRSTRRERNREWARTYLDRW